jgi:hypothetical protein
VIADTVSSIETREIFKLENSDVSSKAINLANLVYFKIKSGCREAENAADFARC